MTVEQPLNLLTRQQIKEMPITLSGRTPRDRVVPPRLKKGIRKEVRFILDVSGSNFDLISLDSRMTKKGLITEVLPAFIRLLEGDDAQAAREQSGGSSKKGGVRMWYANEPQPIEFEEGEDESDDPRDGGDMNSVTVIEKMGDIPWGGRTFLMPAFNAADHASAIEYANLQEDERWDAIMDLVVTDGLLSDPREFDEYLAKNAGPHHAIAVAVIGSGHDDAVNHYKELASKNEFLTYAALTGVTNPEEVVMDLRLLSGTAPE